MKCFIHYFLLAVSALLSYDTYGYSTGNNNKEKLFDIQKLMFIYDMNNIDFNSKERSDTLFRMSGIFPNDTSKQLVYVATGDCSICIATMMDFLITWNSGVELPIPTILIKGSNVELAKFYTAQEFGKDIHINIISIPHEIYAQDGVYLIVKRRILDYLPWTINQ